MTRRRSLVLALVALVAGVLALVVLRGDYALEEPRVLSGEGLRPPAWTRPCWVLRPRTADKPFSGRCARVSGTVLFREGDDPDGDGDRHLLVLAGWHLVKVKYRRGRGPDDLPGPGSQIRVVGRAPNGGRLQVVEAGG